MFPGGPSFSRRNNSESGSVPTTSLRHSVSRRLGTATTRKLWPPDTPLTLSTLDQYGMGIYATILHYDERMYRNSDEFFGRTMKMIAYLPTRLRNQAPFELPQAKIVDFAHKLGASKETLLTASYLCHPHLQLNAQVTLSARNMVETHFEDFLYDLKKLNRKRNLRKLSQSTKTFIRAAENILAMTLVPQEWCQTYKRTFPPHYNTADVACDACYMTKVSGDREGLIALRGIALACTDANLKDDNGFERSTTAVAWSDAVLATYDNVSAAMIEQRSVEMASDIKHVRLDTTTTTLVQVPDTEEAIFDSQGQRLSEQASVGMRENKLIPIPHHIHTEIFASRMASLHSVDVPNQRRPSRSADRTMLTSQSAAPGIKGKLSIFPETPSLLELIPEPLRLGTSKSSRPSDTGEMLVKKFPDCKLKRSFSDLSVSRRSTLGFAKAEEELLGLLYTHRVDSRPPPELARVNRGNTASERGKGPAIPLSVVEDALRSYQAKAVADLPPPFADFRDEPGNDRHSLGASTIMGELERAQFVGNDRHSLGASTIVAELERAQLVGYSLGVESIMFELERAKLVDTWGNSLPARYINPHTRPGTASSIATGSSNAGLSIADRTRMQTPPPIASSSTRRGRRIAFAEQQLTANVNAPAANSSETRSSIRRKPKTSDLRSSANGLPAPTLPSDQPLQTLQAVAYQPYRPSKPTQPGLQPAPVPVATPSAPLQTIQPVAYEPYRPPKPIQPGLQPTPAAIPPPSASPLQTLQAAAYQPYKPSKAVQRSKLSHTAPGSAQVTSPRPELERKQRKSFAEHAAARPSDSWLRLLPRESGTSTDAGLPRTASVRRRAPSSRTSSGTPPAPPQTSSIYSTRSATPGLTSDSGASSSGSSISPPQQRALKPRPAPAQKPKSKLQDPKRQEAEQEEGDNNLWNTLHAAGGLPFRHSGSLVPSVHLDYPAYPVLDPTPRKQARRVPERGSGDAETGIWDRIYAKGGLGFRFSHGSFSDA